MSQLVKVGLIWLGLGLGNNNLCSVQLSVLKFLYQILSEISLLILDPVLSILTLFITQHELRGHGDGPKIVIVERWLSMNIRHVYWKYFLEKMGYNAYLANFPIRKGSFEDSALELSKYLEHHNLAHVTLVGISSGALTSLIYLQEHNGWDRVDKFITVGAPFKGTWMALILFFSYSGRMLLPMSPLIKKISKYKVLYPEKIYCIRAKFDEIVPRGSILPGAHETVLNIVGHNNLHIRIRATYKKIMEYAKTGG